jgi:hypothetical protein
VRKRMLRRGLYGKQKQTELLRMANADVLRSSKGPQLPKCATSACFKFNCLSQTEVSKRTSSRWQWQAMRAYPAAARRRLRHSRNWHANSHPLRPHARRAACWDAAGAARGQRAACGHAHVRAKALPGAGSLTEIFLAQTAVRPVVKPQRNNDVAPLL